MCQMDSLPPTPLPPTSIALSYPHSSASSPIRSRLPPTQPSLSLSTLSSLCLPPWSLMQPSATPSFTPHPTPSPSPPSPFPPFPALPLPTLPSVPTPSHLPPFPHRTLPHPCHPSHPSHPSHPPQAPRRRQARRRRRMGAPRRPRRSPPHRRLTQKELLQEGQVRKKGRRWRWGRGRGRLRGREEARAGPICRGR